MAPSITTVEMVAAAKCALEVHYSQLKRPSPRSLRRRRVQEQIATLDPAESAAVLKLWLRAETDNLRRARLLKTTSVHRRSVRGNLIAGFSSVGYVGRGSFGVVHLVTEVATHDLVEGKHTPSVYAMKVIRKSPMLWAGQEGHLRAERDFLVAAEGSRWVVPLIASFQDKSNLYMVMEYMNGGDFLELLRREEILDEPVARWYVAEMILCVEEVHKMRWIHRDVKPDNFLISASGHLKISDFGLAYNGHWSHSYKYYRNQRQSLLAKFGITVHGDELDCEPELDVEDVACEVVTDDRCGEQRQLARSVVGTSQYMAPEVIKGGPYDQRCDWWSIGIILYECLYGQTPFYRETRQETKQAIISSAMTFAPFPPLSISAIDLLARLLVQEDQRLRSAEEVKSHYFFSGIDWDLLHLTEPPHQKGSLGACVSLSDDRIAERRKGMRPRDKILRDPALAQEALEARKRNTFWGYTYRRPNTL